jgi:hypothetical protein
MGHESDVFKSYGITTGCKERFSTKKNHIKHGSKPDVFKSHGITTGCRELLYTRDIILSMTLSLIHSSHMASRQDAENFLLQKIKEIQNSKIENSKYLFIHQLGMLLTQ